MKKQKEKKKPKRVYCDICACWVKGTFCPRCKAIHFKLAIDKGKLKRKRLKEGTGPGPNDPNGLEMKIRMAGVRRRRKESKKAYISRVDDQRLWESQQRIVRVYPDPRQK